MLKIMAFFAAMKPIASNNRMSARLRMAILGTGTTVKKYFMNKIMSG